MIDNKKTDLQNYIIYQNLNYYYSILVFFFEKQITDKVDRFIILY